MHVLLVTSSLQVTQQVTTALRSDGQTSLTEVWSPQRALALLDEGQAFDVVVADNDTNPTGGYHLAREVKARGRMGFDMPPVLLIVAREQDDYLARWAEADAWVVKPVDSFDLAEAVEALAGRKPVPSLPGVKTLAELGAIGGPGQAAALVDGDALSPPAVAGGDSDS